MVRPKSCRFVPKESPFGKVGLMAHEVISLSVNGSQWKVAGVFR